MNVLQRRRKHPLSRVEFREYITILFKSIDSGDHIGRKMGSSSNQPLFNRGKKKREKDIQQNDANQIVVRVSVLIC